ncbi:MAG: bifunctional acetate--CoA ligase family protein/GNAT family N-acetyltransferase [Planctomycetota bacterium]
MPYRDALDRIFSPTTAAVIGASDSPGVGNTVLNNLKACPTLDWVVPVNPKRDTVGGLPAAKAIGDVAKTDVAQGVAPDLAVVCTPAKFVPTIVRQCGEAGVMGLIILSAGFREEGQAGQQLEQELAAELARFPGMRALGPNCLGAMVPHRGLNATFGSGMPNPGPIAFISQSGALCTSILDWSLQRSVGFSHFISIGNMLDVTFGDLIDHVARNEHTESILLYIESIRDPRKFVSAARAFSRDKPIIAYKAGRFAQSAAAAASHTGAMAGQDDVYDAAFRRAGIERVYEVDDMFACAELLARQRRPRGRKLAMITNAGGPGVMATDALLARDGQLAELSPKTIETLNGILPGFWSHGNPVDVLGDADAKRYADSLEVVLPDPNVDAVLIILTPQDPTEPTETAQAVIKAAKKAGKPVLTAWMGGNAVKEGAELLANAGIANYPTPEAAIGAFMHLAEHSRNLEILSETPREIPALFDVQLHHRRRASEHLIEPPKGQVAQGGEYALPENTAKKLLAAYGIDVAQPKIAKDADDAQKLARKIGYPVVLKLDHPDVAHKTEAGGVALNLKSDAEVKATFERMAKLLPQDSPNEGGVTVQKMITAEYTMELIVGVNRDPVFGSVLLVGTGGVATEILRDRCLELPPLNENLAQRMIRQLLAFPLMDGHRGRPKLAVDQLVELLIRISYLVADHPELKELDINPVLLTPDRAIALDAHAILTPPPTHEKPAYSEPGRRVAHTYDHLAIRPVPEDLRRSVHLKDGTPVTFRPITPEDEPRWVAMVEKCSVDTIRNRFFRTIKEFSHAMASRFCTIDYDRELAIIAEVQTNDGREMIGVGRLVGDGAGGAEFSVFVADTWQKKGLGLLLSDFMLEVAEQRRWDDLHAVTHPENYAMRNIFERFGFTMREDPEEELVHATRGA